MGKLSPLQRVRVEHTSKAELAKKVAKFLQPREGESESEMEARVSHISNTKLLRMWDNQQKLEERYGTREELIEKITRARFSGGNEDYKTKIGGFSTAKLLDLARQHNL